jgi:hypothetical protein
MAVANNKAHYNSNAANNVGPAQGVLLHTVAINTKGATGNTLTLADASGTIAVIDTTAGPAYWVFDCQCNGQLTATLANGTAADVTITYG